MIYFAQAESGGPIKIGHSGNVDARIRELSSHYGLPLALLATLPGGREEERQIHERFAEHRLGRTEQFRPVAEIMAFIGRPLLVGAAPGTIEVMEPNPTRRIMRSFRLSDEIMATIDAIIEHFREVHGETITKTAVIELAIEELAARRLKPKTR